MIYSLGTPSTIVNSSVKSINEDIAKRDNDRLNYKKQGSYVERPVKSDQAEYYYDNNEAVANVVDIKKEDLIKTNYINVESENEEDVSFYETILNNNKKDLSLIVADHSLFGAGVGEIIAIDESTVVIDHVSNKLVEIVLVKDKDGDEYPLVEIKDYEKKVKGYSKIFNYYYPESLPNEHKGFELGYVFWYGGGQFNDFYDKPFYLQLVQEILSQIALKELDTKTLNSGNKLSGVVYINKTGITKIKPNNVNYNHEDDPEDDDEPVVSSTLPENVEVLKKEINTAGLGNAFFYEETKDPMNIDYVNLTNNNQEYVIKKLSSLKKEVYRRGRIPPERYMDSSNKESMNSHKTVAIWEIYLKATNSQQQDFEQYLSDYLFFVYEEDHTVSITVPEFEDFKIAKLQLLFEMFNNAFITLDNAVIEANKIYDWVGLDGLDKWIAKERLYKGRLLTDLTNNTPFDFETTIGDLVDDKQRAV